MNQKGNDRQVTCDEGLFSERLPRVSGHYLGGRGTRYVAERQSDRSELGNEINLRYFLPYLKPSDTLLDFGCGTGGLLNLLSRRVASAAGLEVNPAAADTARKTGCIIYASLEDLPHEPAYDIILSNHVLEHLRDVCTTLERLRAILKPGGVFLAKLPIDDFRARHQCRWSADDIDHHLATWSPRLFANVLYESGFRVKQVRVITSAWSPRLFWTRRFRLDGLAFWLFAVVMRRRQLFAVASKEKID